jgi:DNA-binding transcriptional LysR family regulator
LEPDALNLRHLRAAAAVVRSGSVTGAARLVNLTQPAVTQALAKLERQIGLPLFERVPDGMIATEAGLMLADRVEAAVRMIASPRVTLTQSRAFLALAQAGSYAAAAARTGLSEASLHRAVADLAIGIGQKLIERRGRAVSLTPRGLAIARRLRLARAELSSALAELAALQGREVGRIAVGAMPLSRARLLPDAIATFHRAHPETDIAVAEGSHAELVGPLRDGELDMMVGAVRDTLPADLVQRPLFVDRPVILGRAGHPLATAGITAESLDCYDWIVPERGTPLRRQWEQMFAAAGRTPPRVPIECGSVIMVRQLLVQSDSLTLLSEDQVAVELEAGWLVRLGLGPGEISRTIGLTMRADWRPTARQLGFIAAIETAAAAIGENR